jgi:hypothetical protein
LGRHTFAKISQVEGIELDDTMKAASHEERRARDRRPL